MFNRVSLMISQHCRFLARCRERKYVSIISSFENFIRSYAFHSDCSLCQYERFVHFAERLSSFILAAQQDSEPSIGLFEAIIAQNEIVNQVTK